MGKTQKPLTILVADEDIWNDPYIATLESKGHKVSKVNIEGYDVIIGPKCWRIIPMMGKLSTYLDLMLAGVRAVKYPKVNNETTK